MVFYIKQGEAPSGGADDILANTYDFPISPVRNSVAEPPNLLSVDELLNTVSWHIYFCRSAKNMGP